MPPAEEAPDAQPAPAAKPQGGDSASGRIGRLEKKVQSLQVTIGTLESFLRTKPGTVLPQEAPAPVAPSASPEVDLRPRLEALETQIGALTTHMEQLSRQMSALEAKLSAAPAPIAPPLPSDEPVPERQGQVSPPSPAPSDWAAADAPPEGDEADTSKPRWYGPPPGDDAVADLLKGQAGSGNETPNEKPQSLMAALRAGDPQALYQQG
jgi:hypothetical protein